MKSIAKKRLLNALPSICMLAVIALLCGLSFLPCFRHAKANASAQAAEIDAEAMRALGCCTAYACVNDFDTRLNGKIKARVFGVPYTQTVRGGRHVSGDEFEDTTESVSVFVKAGFKKSCLNGSYSAVKGEYKNGAFTYGGGTVYDLNGYTAVYGKPFTQLVKYDLDNSIVSATAVDEHTFKFVLDVRRATVDCRNEIKNTLSLKSYPEYESVEFTLFTDGARAVKVTSVEQFSIEKFGGTMCRAEYTEEFEYDR